MVTLASQSKGGYYPTPIEELQLITPHLAIHYTDRSRIINALDPCCGEGEALDILAYSIKKRGQVDEVFTYGVELESTRCGKASALLHKVVNDSFEFARTEPKFGFLWLNPPYDEVQNERTEHRFLKILTSTSKNVLQTGGLLMFCIPQHVLKDCAGTLGSRFKNLRVYRFTDKNYPTFKQIVVFAYYLRPTLKEQKEAINYLKDLAEVEPEELPTLAEIDEGFIVPASEEPIKVFRAGKLNVQEVAKDMMHSPVFDEFKKKTVQEIDRAIMKQPILPLKSTHIAIAVASGAIGGNLGTHIVSGVTKQETHVQELYNDDGDNTGQKVSKYYNSAVRVYTQNGIHELS